MSGFDYLIFRAIFGLTSQGFVLYDLGIFLADYLPYLLVLGFLILVAYQNGWRKKLFFGIEGALTVILSRGILTEIIRFLYYRPRPFEALNFSPLIGESGASFPSGHAAFFFALALVIFSINRRWGAWYFVLASLNGLARIFVGVHWPTDIIGGAILGLISGWLVRCLLKPQFEQLKKPVLPTGDGANR